MIKTLSESEGWVLELVESYSKKHNRTKKQEIS